ncbi:MAG: AI-2E family transporter [Pseudomonadota bacterium]|nr:AI-2E family transporter [Pseudomonadota bacterium]
MNLQNTSFMFLLLAATLAFFGLLLDFFQPIFWAASLAVIFQPVYVRSLSFTGQRNSLASLLTMLCIVITVILPAWFVASSFINEALVFYKKISSGEVNLGIVFDWADNSLPMVINFLESVGLSEEDMKANLSSAAIIGSQFIASFAIQAGQNAVSFTVLFFIMLYLLYFFLRDGENLLEKIIEALPFGDSRERVLLTKFAEVSRATLKGTLLIGLVQGALGGIIFWLLGIESPFFWGVLMAILSIIPVVGASLIWVPAALILLINGAIFKAIVMILFGALAIGLIDNLLRPILVGRDTRLPDYLVLLSTLGGLSIFGASGIVIGPLIAVIFLSLWSIFSLELNDSN